MDKFTFFYPADGYSYKNHEIIIRALALLSMKNPLLINNIRVIFTLDSLPFELRNLIHENNLTQIVHLIGKIAYTDVLSYYKSADALLFPSKMESFGLPLIEATCFGLPVIAADLPYAREVLGNYSNKVFVDSDSVDKWVDAIRNYQVYKKVYHNDIDIRENSWKSFFELANRLVQERSHD
ncbi:hypothetical protein FACS189491_09380 [Spirochaetia bacterium]|nr:hypothetical protein FACS189491_09380 [Spirochaetia bacterium]